MLPGTHVVGYNETTPVITTGDDFQEMTQSEATTKKRGRKLQTPATTKINFKGHPIRVMSLNLQYVCKAEFEEHQTIRVREMFIRTLLTIMESRTKEREREEKNPIRLRDCVCYGANLQTTTRHKGASTRERVEEKFRLF